MAEDETTFLCNYKGRRYGTTLVGAKRPSVSAIINHRLLPSDTLQGIALRYGASITEIKRLNNLWSNDSIHCREVLHIPIFSPEQSPVAGFDETSIHSGQSGTVNGRDSCYDSMSETEEQQYFNHQRVEKKSSISEDDEETASCHQMATSTSTTPKKGICDYDKSDCSINDLLRRIDSDITLTASNVKRLEKQSNINHLLNDADGFASTSSHSRHSLWKSTSVESSPEGRRPPIRYTMRELQEAHDQLYQL